MSERPSHEQRRISLRGAVIVAAYLVYLALDRSHPRGASALIGGGGLLLGLAAVDRFGLSEASRSPRMIAGLAGAGIAAALAGLVLVLR